MSDPFCILVVDDHAVVRRGTMDILADLPGERRFLEAASIDEAQKALAHGPVGLVLLDVSLPDGNGLSFLQRLTREHPDLPVVVLSMHHEAEYARRALALGARGYLSKNSAPEELSEALAAVLAGRTYVSTSLMDGLERAEAGARACGLSRREREVAYRLGQGEKLSDVAAAMGVSITTAGTYRARVMRKLGLKTTADFFRYAIERQGLF